MNALALRTRFRWPLGRPSRLGTERSGSRVNRAERSAVRTSVYLALIVALCGWGAGCNRFQKRSSVAELEQARQLSFRGFEKGQDGKWDEAERFFRQAVEVCPQDERAHALLADALWHKRNVVEAIEEQRQAVIRSGGDPRQHVRLGEMLLEIGRLEDAISQAEVAIEKNRLSPEGWNLKGRVLLAEDKLPDALACFHRSLSYDKKQVEVLEQVALIYELTDRPQRALATWFAVEELYTDEAIPGSILYREALAMQRLNRERRALDLLADAQQRDPQSPEIVVALADLRWKLGDHENARLTWQYGWRQWPDHPQLMRLADAWQMPAQDRLLLR